jgi:hypothetical protein
MQLELAKARVAFALPLRVMLAQAPLVTSTVSVAPLTVMLSVESGCPPGPEPPVIALQLWLVLIEIAVPCTEIAPSENRAAIIHHAKIWLLIKLLVSQI